MQDLKNSLFVRGLIEKCKSGVGVIRKPKDMLELIFAGQLLAIIIGVVVILWNCLK